MAPLSQNPTTTLNTVNVHNASPPATHVASNTSTSQHDLDAAASTHNTSPHVTHSALNTSTSQHDLGAAHSVIISGSDLTRLILEEDKKK